jgi:hypothetical protein
MNANDKTTLELPVSYEAPEAIELGEASLLTLGNYGCRTDNNECEKIDSDAFDF